MGHDLAMPSVPILHPITWIFIAEVFIKFYLLLTFTDVASWLLLAIFEIGIFSSWLFLRPTCKKSDNNNEKIIKMTLVTHGQVCQMFEMGFSQKSKDSLPNLLYLTERIQTIATVARAIVKISMFDFGIRSFHAVSKMCLSVSL